MVMAHIYINCEEFDKAIDELNYLLSFKAGQTVNYLKLIGWIDPLRELPRYKELEKKYALIYPGS